jgi:Spy/CpxP family protein refolding chaperone
MTPPLPPEGASGAHSASRRPRALATLVVVIALLTGIVAGMATDRRLVMRYHGGPFGGRFGPGGRGLRGAWGGDGGHSAPTDRMRQRFATELGLTPAQMTQVDSIMGRSMAQRHAIEDSVRPRMRAILDSARSQIENILTPDQRQKFEAWRSRNHTPPS